jgi:F-type H+-transporting ATPase subunit b
MMVHHIIIFATAEAAEAASGGGLGFIGTLGLDWKLLLAQLINFSIILFILWKWVFGPVTKALEQRRQKIEDSVKKAEDIEKRVGETDLERENILKTARVEAEKINKKALETAEASKKEIVDRARVEAEKILADTKREIESSKETMLKEVKGEIANLTILATEKIIKQKLDSKQDKQLIDEALREIKK